MYKRRRIMLIKNWKEEILTIPNLLSLLRLVLIPIYVTIYLNATVPTDYLLAGAILAVSCLTDMVDGKIARHFNMISTVGKILDPLADKLTQFSLIICLTKTHKILWFLVGLFVAKESFQLIAGTINLKRGKMLKGALISGKICTTVLFISLIAMVLFPQLDRSVVTAITIIDSIFMLIAFIDYASAYRFRGDQFQDVDLLDGAE